jgi:hypothetical protein
MAKCNDDQHADDGTLVLAILAVRSSYALQIELPLKSEADVPDTLQCWIVPTGTWRIRHMQ